MSALPLPAPRPMGLRVALLAEDARRRLALLELLAAAGHAVVDPGDAEVLLADGTVPAAAALPVLAIGGSDEGQAGLLPREASPAQIDAGLRAVAAGLTVRPAEGTGFEPLSEAVAPLLSPRELEILAAIGEGASNKEVARRLGISPHTVKFHVESLFRKLGAASRAEAVAKGLRRQIIHL